MIALGVWCQVSWVRFLTARLPCSRARRNKAICSVVCRGWLTGRARCPTMAGYNWDHSRWYHSVQGIPRRFTPNQRSNAANAVHCTALPASILHYITSSINSVSFSSLPVSFSSIPERQSIQTLCFFTQ